MDETILADSLEDAERFASVVLGLSIYDWQGEILYSASQIDPDNPDQRKKMAVRAPNGAGKDSFIIGPLALWWIRRFRRGQVAITTKDSKQLINQTWPALSRHRAKFQDCHWREHDHTIITPTGGKVTAWVTDDPDRAEGYHADNPDAPLLFFINEAKSVPDDIFDAVNRCTFNCLVEISSSGGHEGRFYKHFTEQRDQYETYSLTLKDCPHIPESKVRQIEQEYGQNHPFTRSTIYGEFMETEEGIDYVCPLNWIEKNLAATLGVHPGVRVAGLDFAAGGDRNAMCVRNGNAVEKNGLLGWRERDTASATGRFLIELGKRSLTPKQCWGDADGLGVAIINDMAAARFNINKFYGGRRSPHPLYKNLISYCWHEVAKKIRNLEIVFPREKEKLTELLIAQLSTRRTKVTNDGKFWLESKDDMRARGVESPDIADAFCLSFGVQPYAATSWTAQESRFSEIAAAHGWDYSGESSDDSDYGGSTTRSNDFDDGLGSGFGGVHSE